MVGARRLEKYLHFMILLKMILAEQIRGDFVDIYKLGAAQRVWGLFQ